MGTPSRERVIVVESLTSSKVVVRLAVCPDMRFNLLRALIVTRNTYLMAMTGLIRPMFGLLSLVARVRHRFLVFRPQIENIYHREWVPTAHILITNDSVYLKRIDFLLEQQRETMLEFSFRQS